MDIKKIIRESLEKVLKEHTVTFSKADMAKLHKDGKITKKDDKGKDHDYIYDEQFELEKEKMTDPDDMRMYKEAKLPKRFTVKSKQKIGDTLYNPGTYALKKKRAGGGIYLNMDNNQMLGVDEGDIKQLTENMSKGYAVVYRDRAYDKTYTAQIPPGISKAEIVKMLKKVIRVGLEIVSIKSLNEIEVDPDAEFKLDLKHLLKKHLIKKEDRDFHNPGSKPTMKQLKPLLKRGSTVTIKDGLAKLVDFYNEFYEFGHESTDKISDNLSKAIDALRDKKDKVKAAKLLKKFNKDSKDALRKGINESKKYVIIDPKGNASPIGSKMQGLMHIKDKKGYHVVLAKNATKARRAIEKNGGKSHSAKVYAQMYNLMREDSVNESVSPSKAADVIFRKLAASKLIGKQYKRAATNLLTYMIARRNFKVSDPKIVAGYLFQDLESSKLILPQNRSRAVAVIANLISNMKLEIVNEAFIGPFVFSDSMSDAELKAMYQGALDGYANYSKGFQHPKSAYKKAYQAIEKILKKRGINEASDVWKIFDEKQKLYGQAMDIETDMKTIAMDIKQKRKDMEQEAEPGGGKVADRYGKELNKLENNFNKKKKELKKIFAKLDKLEMI